MLDIFILATNGLAPLFISCNKQYGKYNTKKLVISRTIILFPESRVVKVINYTKVFILKVIIIRFMTVMRCRLS